jgi:hypothetical protein
MGRVTALGGVLAVLCALLRISGTVVAGEPVERPSCKLKKPLWACRSKLAVQ